ncbi:hypothetical protein KORDIASMS9_00383 [Kordia sp. SMS9]|nr:hypothetical protein KORDIASMS9_00383 [Kordia sp. SMS9]
MCIKKIPIFDLQIVGKCLFVYKKAFSKTEAFFVDVNVVEFRGVFQILVVVILNSRPSY